MPRKHSFPTGAMPFGVLLVCLMVLMGATQTAAQCPDPDVLLYYEAPCGSGLNTGQSFTAPTTGQLDSLRLADVQARTPGWSFADSMGRVLLGIKGPSSEADQVLSRNSDANALYKWWKWVLQLRGGWFTFHNLALKKAKQYILHLINGAAATSCNLSYDGGSAFTNTGEKQGEDLAFDLYFCPGDFTSVAPILGVQFQSCCHGRRRAVPKKIVPETAAEPLMTTPSAVASLTSPSPDNASDVRMLRPATSMPRAPWTTACYYPNCEGSCPEFLDFYEAPVARD